MIKLTQEQKDSIINEIWKNKWEKKNGSKFKFKGAIKELNVEEFYIKCISNQNNDIWMWYEFVGEDYYICDEIKIQNKLITFKNIMEPILDLVIAKNNLSQL